MLSGDVLGTAAFKVVLANTAVFALAFLVLLGLFYVHARGRVLEQIDSDITGERQALLAVLDKESTPGLIAALGRRRDRAEAHYQLLDPDGHVLAGDLPPVQTPFGWGWVAIPPDPVACDDGLLRAWAERLPGGGSLLVGRNPRRLDELEDTVFSGLLWSEFGTLLFGFASGYLVSRHALRGVAIVADAAELIGAGDLAHRIPDVGRGTEIETITETVNIMLDRIGTLTDSLRQVTDDIAHDLRTPLGRLRQTLEMTTRTAQTVESSQAAVDRALDETDAIIATFNALLRIAQVEAEDRRDRFSEVDLTSVVQRLAEVYGASVEEAGGRFRATIMPGVRVFGDVDLLGQMIANLIENALRHTPAGTAINLILSMLPSGRPRLVVADKGPGVPASERQRVLGRFVRLDASRNTFGTGLGLALVKAVADLHGVELALEDANPGLRVVLGFPDPSTVASPFV